MHAHVKEKWLEVLRSGKVEQGQEYLRILTGYDDEMDEDVDLPKPKYCCLGVLCDILAPNDWAGSAHRLREGYPDMSIIEMAGGFPARSAEDHWTEVEGGILPFKDRDEHTVTLAVANDFGCTFPQIADLIEMFF